MSAMWRSMAVFWGLVMAGGVQVWPGWLDLALMVVLGVLATVGHFLFTAAYREAAASLLAPVNYLHLVWAAALGAAVFGHVPDAITLVGMAMVAGAGAAVALRAQFGAKVAEAP